MGKTSSRKSSLSTESDIGGSSLHTANACFNAGTVIEEFMEFTFNLTNYIDPIITLFGNKAKQYFLLKVNDTSTLGYIYGVIKQPLPFRLIKTQSRTRSGKNTRRAENVKLIKIQEDGLIFENFSSEYKKKLDQKKLKKQAANAAACFLQAMADVYYEEKTSDDKVIEAFLNSTLCKDKNVLPKILNKLEKLARHKGQVIKVYLNAEATIENKKLKKRIEEHNKKVLALLNKEKFTKEQQESEIPFMLIRERNSFNVHAPLVDDSSRIEDILQQPKSPKSESDKIERTSTSHYVIPPHFTENADKTLLSLRSNSYDPIYSSSSLFPSRPAANSFRPGFTTGTPPLNPLDARKRRRTSSRRIS